MTEKPAAPIFNELFGDVLQPAPQPEPDPALVSEEAHAKLKRNLSIALDVHKAAMEATLPNIEIGNKRLMVEAANMTVKAALTTDKTSLKARSEKTIERVLLRLLVIRILHGCENRPEDEKKLRSTPRPELEAALGPKLLATYDKMDAAAAPGEPLKPPPSRPEPPPDPAPQEALTRAFGR
jgi:hypothetical protein